MAHYLIQSCRSHTNKETSDSVCHSSVKRVLPFAEMEEIVTKESLESDKDENRTSDWKIEEDKKQGILVLVKRPLSFSNKEAEETVCSEENAVSAQMESKVEGEPESKDEQEVGLIDKENNAQTKRNYGVSMEQGQDSIGGRLRQRRTLQNGSNDSEKDAMKWGLDLSCATDDGSAAINGLTEPAVEEKLEQLKSENGEVKVIDKESHAKPKRKRVNSTEPDQDSIGGRLRQRRRSQTCNNDLGAMEKSLELKDSVNDLGKKLDMGSATDNGLVEN